MSSPAAPNMVGAAAMFAAVARLVAARIAVVDQVLRLRSATAERCRRARRRRRSDRRGDELLVPERSRSRAAVAGGDVDGGFVDEFHSMLQGPAPQTTKPRRMRGFVFSWISLGSGRLDDHGLAVQGAPLTSNRTWPSTSANSVWSRPMPTLVPGGTGAALAHDDGTGADPSGRQTP